jgi:hypothetical protein
VIKVYKYFPIVLLLISLIIRFSGLKQSHPFWHDEFSSGYQSRMILENGLKVFSDKNLGFESYNITSHFLMALSFVVLGVSEFSARLPMTIIGSFLPIVAYLLLVKKDKKLALISGLLLTFSYFQVTWSLQARSYPLVQLLSLFGVFVYLKAFEEKFINFKNNVLIFLICLLGLLTHTSFIFLIITFLIHYLVNNYLFLKKKSLFFYLVAATSLILTGYVFNIYPRVFDFFTNFNLYNNIWYYHSFFWRQYSLLTLLAIVGFFSLRARHKSLATLISLYIFFCLSFFTFLWGHYISKYMAVFFNFYLILAAEGVLLITDSLVHKLKIKSKIFDLIIILSLTGFIIINGNLFVNKPQNYYSVNFVTRDISINNYNLVYDIIKNKANIDDGIAVIDPWGDRIKWYLGSDYPSMYVFRWEDEGYQKTTLYRVDDQGQKYLFNYGRAKVRYIANLEDLLKVMEKHNRGFIWIDDSTLPVDVIDYAKKNFKKDLYTESYAPELLENPYSIWPATLYSWGFDQ